jgi:hypothetical protein
MSSCELVSGGIAVVRSFVKIVYPIPIYVESSSNPPHTVA